MMKSVRNDASGLYARMRGAAHCIGIGALVFAFAPFVSNTQCAAGEAVALPTLWDPPKLELFSPLESGNWKLGVYEGFYAQGRLRTLMYDPFAAKPRSEMMLAGNAVYRVLALPYIPVDIELDLVGALHFGAERSFGEFAIAPTFRWKWFPWNDFVYTTYRLGVAGASYTTRESQFERLETVNFHTAKLLNFWVSEITLAPDSRSNFEGFLRVHHRSGAYGRINHVVGGSNYLALGIRVRR